MKYTDDLKEKYQMSNKNSSNNKVNFLNFFYVDLYIR